MRNSLLLAFTEGLSLRLQAYSPQWLCVLLFSQTDYVFQLICKVPPATLNHGGRQSWHRPRPGALLSLGPVEEHVQHQRSKIVPGEKSRISQWHFTSRVYDCSEPQQGSKEVIQPEVVLHCDISDQLLMKCVCVMKSIALESASGTLNRTLKHECTLLIILLLIY